jgi:CRP-like cAMP-binding protein
MGQHDHAGEDTGSAAGPARTAGDQLARLAVLCEHVKFPAGQRLFEEGRTADRFWLIDAGQVALDEIVPGRAG